MGISCTGCKLYNKENIMKKIKKIWALLLIAALSVSILAGCGKKKEDNNSNVKLDPDNLVSANVEINMVHVIRYLYIHFATVMEME